MSAYSDLVMDQCADFASAVTLQADDGSAINVTGYVFSSQMRKSYYSAIPAANLTINILDAANGVTELYLDAANTANIFPGRYVYDVLMKDTANQVTRVVHGIMTVTPGVTNQVFTGNT